MKYVIGIDSGGTKYRLKAAMLDGTVLGYYEGKPANIYSQTKNEVIERIDDNIDALLSIFGGKREDASYILCGTTGLDSCKDDIILNEIYSSLGGFSCPVKVINDAELALYTVTGGFGVLIISGTGAIAVGRRRDGKTARAGGWLFTINGDEGSGAWVSRSALRYLGRYYDQAVERDILIELIENELKIKDREGLNELASSMGNRPWSWPALGEVVDRAAVSGSTAAVEILHKAAVEVMSIVNDVVYALRLDEKEPNFNLGLWGSNIIKSTVMQDYFISKAVALYPEARIMLPEKESVDGAVELALQELKM